MTPAPDRLSEAEIDALIEWHADNSVPFEMKTRPTIDELEAILNVEADPPRVNIKPDGSVEAVTTTTQERHAQSVVALRQLRADLAAAQACIRDTERELQYRKLVLGLLPRHAAAIRRAMEATP
jgi:hypothetical protein